MVAVLVAIGRPLLFASIDPAVATARRAPVRSLGVVFLASVGASAGVATQAIGALLIVGLLSAPAGAASHLTSSPYAAMAWSAGLAAGSMTTGIVLSVEVPSIPPSFAIISVATLSYVAAAAGSALRRRQRAGDDGRVRPLLGPDPSGRAV